MEKNKKETAIEWIVSTINDNIVYIPMKHWDLIRDIIQQAKQMEKEQKIEFAKHCLNKALDLDTRTAYKDVEQYYNDTYGKE